MWVVKASLVKCSRYSVGHAPGHARSTVTILVSGSVYNDITQYVCFIARKRVILIGHCTDIKQYAKITKIKSTLKIR